jgi:hypothetical protein
MEPRGGAGERNRLFVPGSVASKGLSPLQPLRAPTMVARLLPASGAAPGRRLAA